MTKPFQDFYFRQWQVKFFAAVAPKAIYQDTILVEKLKQHLFFSSLALENIPFYGYGKDVQTFLDCYPQVADAVIFEREEASFLHNKEEYLKICLKTNLLIQGLFIPDLLKDLYKYYPLFQGLYFGEEAFLYLDFGSQIPYVMTTVFEDLILLGYSTEILTEKSLSSFLPKEIYSDEAVADYTKEALCQHVVKYFVDDASDDYFSKILKLYIEARPLIKQDLIKALQGKGKEVTSITMVKEFLGEKIFEGVSLKAQRFCVANMDLTNKDFTKVTRLEWKDYWDKLTVENQAAKLKEAQMNYNSAKEYLEAQNKRSEIEKNLEVAEYFYKISTMDSFERNDAALKESITPKNISVLPWELRALQYQRGLKEFINMRATKK